VAARVLDAGHEFHPRAVAVHRACRSRPRHCCGGGLRVPGLAAGPARAACLRRGSHAAARPSSRASRSPWSLTARCSGDRWLATSPRRLLSPRCRPDPMPEASSGANHACSIDGHRQKTAHGYSGIRRRCTTGSTRCCGFPTPQPRRTGPADAASRRAHRTYPPASGNRCQPHRHHDRRLQLNTWSAPAALLADRPGSRESVAHGALLCASYLLASGFCFCLLTS
jgi:hypothetical protein